MMTNVLMDPRRVERVCRKAVVRGQMTGDLFRLWEQSHRTESFTLGDALLVERTELALEAEGEPSNVVEFRRPAA